MKSHFDMKGWTPSLALRTRLKLMLIMMEVMSREICYFNGPLQESQTT